MHREILKKQTIASPAVIFFPLSFSQCKAQCSMCDVFVNTRLSKFRLYSLRKNGIYSIERPRYSSNSACVIRKRGNTRIQMEKMEENEKKILSFDD